MKTPTPHRCSASGARGVRASVVSGLATAGRLPMAGIGAGAQTVADIASGCGASANRPFAAL
jgi:hypothetical protein